MNTLPEVKSSGCNDALKQAEIFLAEGKIQKSKDALKTAMLSLAILPEEERDSLEGKVGDIRRGIARVLALEAICLSYKNSPQKTEALAQLLQKTTKQRHAAIAKHLQKVLG